MPSSNNKIQLEKTYFQSPIGMLEICGTDKHICSILFIDHQQQETSVQSKILNNCVKQLQEYFRHQRKDFDLPLNPDGSSFQNQVWRILQTIPYGSTASYLDVAQKIGNPKAVRAVGGANGKNPITIIIPCHRVIGANGKLVGYGGGMWRKKWLLQHEQNL